MYITRYFKTKQQEKNNPKSENVVNN